MVVRQCYSRRGHEEQHHEGGGGEANWAVEDIVEASGNNQAFSGDVEIMETIGVPISALVAAFRTSRLDNIAL